MSIIAPLLFTAATATVAGVIATTLVPALPRIIALLMEGNQS